MIFNPIASGDGGSKKFEFTYNPTQGGVSDELNGNPISVGEVVQLEAGSENYLYASAEGMRLITDSGFNVPLGLNTNYPQTRAPAPAQWVSFVMPNENCEYRFGK